ncbi:optineurin isoform X1 [Pygocentrus nattereri]|uniref:Optineurin n=2 Tax=Pygocentrus nattereri TaxID=42514 RepID=A0A3B4DQV4_PYGNA|nr:optineurin isoform X1 [Pygocentrus nattereri]
MWWTSPLSPSAWCVDLRRVGERGSKGRRQNQEPLRLLEYAERERGRKEAEVNLGGNALWPVEKMASSLPMVNGDLTSPLGSHSPGTSHVEETLQQMNILIKENRELKEALKQTNLTMKERFEGLTLWKEKQKEERNFLESRLEEARERVRALDAENELLKKRVQELESHAAAGEGEGAGVQAKLEALKSQIARLQAEKSDLVAMNSELQLKMGQGSPEDSFIEIRIEKGEMNVTKDLPVIHKESSASSTARCDLPMPRPESEEQTVRQLLQSLRQVTQQKEQLQLQLQTASKRIAELELQPLNTESETQTSLPCTSTADTQTKSTEEDTAKSASEVENMKAQMMSLFKELQQAQSKLDEAENMKKSLQDRCKDLEQDLTVLKTQLGERQQIQAENDKLKVQLDSMQAAVKLEQKKAQDEKNSLAQLKDAYTKLFEDYNELKEENKKKEDFVSSVEFEELQGRLAAAEQALADKQQKIDEMKQEIFQKEKDLETISVFQAQAEVYSSDFYAERAAREKIHEEKERLSAQLEFVKKHNSQLQDELESLGRQSMSELQRRHVSRGANPGGSSPHQLQGGRVDWQQQVNIPEHACPKCGEVLPDLDTLQIHIMDCII